MPKSLMSLIVALFAFLIPGAHAQTAPTLAVMDDLSADLDLIHWAMTKQPLDMKFYIRRSKLLDPRVNLGNAFDEKREIDRTSAIAQAKQSKLINSTFVAIAGPCCFSIASYDFATKSFHVTTDQLVRAASAANARAFLATPTGAHIIFEDQRQAEQIERTRIMHAGTRAQVVDVFRLKSSTNEGTVYADRVAFVLFGNNGQQLLSAIFNNVNQPEREFLQTIGYNAVLRP